MRNTMEAAIKEVRLRMSSKQPPRHDGTRFTCIVVRRRNVAIVGGHFWCQSGARITRLLSLRFILR